MAATFDLTGTNAIPQGADYTYTVTLQNAAGAAIDLTGCTLASQVRCNHDGDLLGAFTVGVTAPPTGVATLTMTSSVTSQLPATAAGLYWRHDVMLTRTDGSVVRLLEGNVQVDPSITR
jgi:hypothetical protein